MKTKIKFGTDGFRGIMGKDFNQDTVKKIIMAIAEYLKEGVIIIGYDPRLNADKYADFAAEVLCDYGFDVMISNKVVPTPTVAYMACNVKNCAGAIMFTASHNPKEYLGIKFIPNYGGPATSEITKEIEDIIENKTFTLEKKDGSIAKQDFFEFYYEGLKKLIDFEAIRKNPPKIIYDGLFSASIGYFDRILNLEHIGFEVFNNWHDPNFGGFLPEPKKDFMKHSKQNYITVANDGDADRYGVIDENGKWVSPNIILAILLKYLKEKGEEGVCIKTVGVSQLVDIVAKKLNVKVIETPVGFKWIGSEMRMNKAIIGGEDSGGLSIGAHISEKDGIFANLLIIEMLSKTNKTLVQLEKEIINFAGAEFYQDRVDIKLESDDKKEKVISIISNEEKFASQNIIDKTAIDGIKLHLEDGFTKILIRKSGTEPLLRFYIESIDKSTILVIKEFIKGYVYAFQ